MKDLSDEISCRGSKLDLKRFLTMEGQVQREWGRGASSTNSHERRKLKRPLVQRRRIDAGEEEELEPTS